MAPKVVKVLAEDGESPTAAIDRVIAKHKKDGIFSVDTTYEFDDKNTPEVEALSKTDLAKAQLGGGDMDPDKVTEAPKSSPSPSTLAKSEPATRPGESELMPKTAALYQIQPFRTTTRTSLPTFVKFRAFKLQGGHEMQISDEFQIGDFSNEAQFEEQLDILTEKFIRARSGILVDVKHEPYLAKIRAPVGMGFGPEALDGLDTTDYEAKIGMFLDRKKKNVIEDDGSVSVYEEDVSYFAHPFEVKLRALMEPYNEANLVYPADFHRYVKAMFSDKEYHVLPLPSDHDPRFERMYLPQPTAAYTFFMDKNIQYRTSMVKYMTGLIESTIIVAIKHYSDTFGELLRAMQINVATIDRLPGVVKGLRSDDATRLIVALMTSLTMGKWAKIDLTFNVSAFSYDLPMLIYCFFAKLVIPWHCLTRESVITVDNYLFMWLFRADLKTSAVGDPYRNLTPIDLNLGQVNYLSQAYNDGAFKNPNEHRPFLFTDGLGGGWSVPEGDVAIPMAPGFTRFTTPGRRYATFPLGGRLVTDDVTTPTQVLRFLRLNTFVQKMTLRAAGNFDPPLKEREKQAIAAMLMGIVDHTDSASVLMNRINEIVLRLNALPISDPINPSDPPNIRFEPIRLPVRLGGAMSLYLLKPELESQVVTLSHYEAGLAITTLANTLAVVYEDVRARYAPYKIYWTKSRINDLVKQRVGNHPLLSGFFDLLKPQLNDLMQGGMPDARVINYDNDLDIRRFNAVRKLVRDNIELFGVTRRHYYVPDLKRGQLMPSPQSRGKDLFRDVFVVNQASLRVVHRYASYNALYDDILEEKITSKFNQARETQNGAILFDFPFKLRVSESARVDGLGLVTAPATIRLDIPSGTAESGVQAQVTFTYVQNDQYTRRDANRYALLTMPHFVLPWLPVRIDGKDFNWSDFQHYLRSKTEWRLIDPSTYFDFSRRIDV